ncbi:MAG TPA: VanZ family protein [Bacilli bacterium]|nr:VanZ family protein [Bacilli bacterium]
MKNNAKWFVLSLYVFINGLIIFESTLSGGPSGLRSQFIASVFGNIINVATPPREPEIITVESVVFSTSDNKVLNNNDHYFIPVGITRRISPLFTPEKPTDRGINYTSSDESIVRVTQGGYLEARELGDNVEITALIASNNSVFNFLVSVVPKGPPADYSAELRDNNGELALYSSTTIDVFIKKGEDYIAANTLYNHEYDLTTIPYYSDDESIATVNKYGVISTHQVGSTYVGIEGKPEARFLINVTAEAVLLAEEITFAAVSDDPLPYYIYQKTELLPTFLKNGAVIEEAQLIDNGLTFVAENEAIASVYYDTHDQKYYLYGTKLAGSTTIDVYINSNFRINNEFIPDFSFSINVNEVLPTKLSLAKTNNTLSIDVGQKRNITAELSYDETLLPEGLTVTNQEVIYSSSDDSIATVSSVGTNGVLLGRKEGTVTITAKSVANPSLTAEMTFEITPLAFINDGNFGDFHAFVRKAVGHFSLFLVNGLLGYITFLLLTKKNHKIIMALSLSVGLFIAAVSEFIQYFVPRRSGNIVDIAINFSGYLIGTLIVFLVLLIKEWRKKRQISKKQNEETD